MNFKIEEWEEINEYAIITCKHLRNKGYITYPKPYTMYNGSKGLYLEVYDTRGAFYRQYATGIQTDINKMKKIIDSYALKITLEI